MGLREIVLPLFPRGVRRGLDRLRAGLFDGYARGSYSQEGEDMVLQRIFSGKQDGFYVDVGAHHPRRFSNTYFFYQRGWSGINIEPNPDSIRALRSERKRDVNLQCGISDRAGTLSYYMFDDAALNTFDGNLAKSRVEGTPYKLLATSAVAVERLDAVLGRHLPAGGRIDFLSVDAEGLDLPVLKSNDWSRYRPDWVLAEVFGASLERAMESPAYRFMKDQGYDLFAKTFNTLIFGERKAIEALARTAPVADQPAA